MARNTQFNLTLTVNDKVVKDTLNGVGKELRKVRAQTRNLTEGTKEYEEKTKELAELEDIYDGMRKSQREFLNEMKGVPKAVEDQKDSISGVKKEISEARKEADRLTVGSKEWIEANEKVSDLEDKYRDMKDAQNDLLTKTEENTEEVEKQGTAIKDLGGGFQKMFSAIKSGDLSGFREGLKGAQAGMMGLTKASLSFIATGVGAIIAALAAGFLLVRNAMNRNEESMEKLKRAFAPFSGIISKLMGVLEPLGDLIIDGIVVAFEALEQGMMKTLETLSSGLKWLGLDSWAESVDEFAESIEDATEAGRKLEEQEQRLGRLRRESKVALAEENREIAKQKALRDDANQSQEDRIAAGEKVNEFIEKQEARERELAELQLNIVNEKIAQEGRRSELLDEQADAVARLSNIEEKADNRRRRETRRLQGLQSKAAKEHEAELKKLSDLEEEYDKKREDREADTAIKQAELEKKRALEKAEALNASNELLDQIRAEHDEKIKEAEEERAEKEAEARKEKEEEEAERRKEKEEEELDLLKEHEERKKELLDELAVQKAESDEEREQILEEQEREKQGLEYEAERERFEEEMEQLELDAEEKATVLEALEESHQATIDGIKQKYVDKEIKQQEDLQKAKIQLWNDSLDAAVELAGEETKVGEALLLAKQIMAAQETAIQLGLFQNKMSLNVAEATGDIAKGTAKTAASAPFPYNIPLILGFTTQVAGIVSSIKKMSTAKKEVKGFADGGFTDMFGTGHIDETGKEVAGVVHTGEYVVPEVVREDPEVPQILQYLETKRQRKLGLYADGGDTSEASDSSDAEGAFSDFAKLKSTLDRLNQTLESGINAPIYFGYEAELKRQEQQKKLEEIERKSSIKNKNNARTT